MAINEHNDQIIVQTSRQFKDAVATFSQTHDTPMSQVVRTAVAAYIGYDLSAEVKPPRKTRYESPEARTLAQQERNLIRRRLMAAIQKAMAQGDIEYAQHLAETYE